MTVEELEPGQVWQNQWGEEFRIDRVEPLPAEQGYVQGTWVTRHNRPWMDTLRFNTILGGRFKLVKKS